MNATLARFSLVLAALSAMALTLGAGVRWS
jgi:hypothetical protein